MRVFHVSPKRRFVLVDLHLFFVAQEAFENLKLKSIKGTSKQILKKFLRSNGDRR